MYKVYKVLKDFLRRNLPRGIYKILHGIRVVIRSPYILGFEYGLVKSAFRWSVTDKLNRPIPWYTYAAIDYLDQLDFSEKRVFEYGSGNSTLYWSQRCKAVVAVEHSEEW